MKNWAHCKLSSFFRFTKIVKMKKKQQERRKEGSGRDKIEREKGQEGGGKEGEKDGVGIMIKLCMSIARP